MVDILAQGSPFGTEGSPIVGIFFSPFHFNNLSILDREVEAALGHGIADGANGLFYLDAGFLAGYLAPQKMI
jgi:hypothetical protein